MKYIPRILAVTVVFLVVFFVRSDGVNSAPRAWKTAQLSQPRSWLASTTVGDKAMFAGGAYKDETGYHHFSDTVDVYDNSSDTWTTEHLSIPRSQLAATSVGDKALFAGGTSSSGSEAGYRVDIYDDSTGEWSIATMSANRTYMSATTVGNKAMFVGTGDRYGVWVDIYDDSTGEWSTAPLSGRRDFIVATSVGTKAFFAGGKETATSYSSSVIDIYDDSTGEWSIMNLSIPRYGLTATVLGSKVYFAGGHNYSSEGPVNETVDVVEIYDVETDIWTQESLFKPIMWQASVTVGDKAMFAGGIVGSSNYSSIVDIFDATANKWSKKTLSQKRVALTATTVGDKAMFAGGEFRKNNGVMQYVDVVDIFDDSL